MDLMYGAAAPAPPLPVNPWQGMNATWTGWDGSLWHLNDPSGGVFLELKGVEGLGKPSRTQWVQSSPSVPGQFFRGAIANARPIFWPLFVYSEDGTEDWISIDQAFWRTMHAEKYGTWTVTRGNGAARSLRCRFVDDGSHAFEMDPFQNGWAAYGVKLVADQPFWAGDPVVSAWRAATATDFFNGSAKAAPFNIASGSTLSTATMTNPGDEDAWPEWTIIGDSSTASVGVGASQTVVPFTIPAGKAVVIDTDPTVQTAVMYDYTPAAGQVPAVFANPADRTADLGASAFAPIPAGQDRALSISMTGGGSIQAKITPLYERAW